MSSAGPRVAIAHDYLTQRGGAERVVLAMLRAFPDATIYTTLYDRALTYPEFEDALIVPSALNSLKFFRRHHRLALPFLPLVAESIEIDADVVLVSSSGWAHGFSTRARRLVYCYSPARWLYQTDDYLGGPAASSASGLALLAMRPALRAWDRRAAQLNDRYLAISRVVQQRIQDTYGLNAPVVPAPHSMDTSLPQEPLDDVGDGGGFHLLVSRLLPYKKVDTAIEAFRGMPSRRLVVVGAGPLERELRRTLPTNVTMVQGISDAQLRWLYAQCVGIVAPSLEDYGLTPLEAAAFGKPSVTLRGGGYLDTVLEGVTGVHFDEPVPEAVAAAVAAAAEVPWDYEAIRAHADRFSEESFARRLRAEVTALWADGAEASG
ncbi:MAG: glycosyltransferase [Tetrasphaera sp.]|nr:glycosyltransferase [Tetrasphaera sp.]